MRGDDGCCLSSPRKYSAVSRLLEWMEGVLASGYLIKPERGQAHLAELRDFLIGSTVPPRMAFVENSRLNCNKLTVGKVGLAPQRGCPAGDPALAPLVRSSNRSMKRATGSVRAGCDHHWTFHRRLHLLERDWQ